MNCSKAKANIYLYNEITATEQEEVDAHVAKCSSCKRIAEQVASMNSVITQHRLAQPHLENHAHATRRIMESIEAFERRKSRVWPAFGVNILERPLRYGMAILSLSLVAFFLGEYVQGQTSFEIRKSYPHNPRHKAELNLASFHNAFLTARKTKDASPTRLSRCVTICLADEGTCEECASKIVKP